MIKKKASRKRYFSLNDIPRFDIQDEQNLKEFKPEDYFTDQKRVAEILFQCLSENNTEAYTEILDAYTRVNKSRTLT